MSKSYLEQSLLQQIRWAKLPEPKTEYRAIPDRRFRFDLAYPKIRLLIEVQGGIWRKGGHSTGKGISRDYEKNNLAVQNGWRVLYFTAEMIESGEALAMIEKELERNNNGKHK